MPVKGIPEIRPGDDLSTIIATSSQHLQDGDILVVTQKIVSKAEGRLISTPTDTEGREAARQQAVSDEAVRIVAQRGSTLITETRHGFVLAASGVDASNVHRNELALLPVDSDRSAARIRDGIFARLGVVVGVIVSDTFGRTWRNGLTDVAIGAAGVGALRDHRGEDDVHGNTLAVTEVAVVDEVAGAAELVMGKLDGVPVAVVRGLAYRRDDAGVRPLVRAAGTDMFLLGTDEARRSAVPARRTVRQFVAEPVDLAIVERAVAAAVPAPAPRRTTQMRFVLLNDEPLKSRLLESMEDARRADLEQHGAARDGDRRISGNQVLRKAPLLVVPCLVPDGVRTYPEAVHQKAEREMFLLAAGASVENLLIALAAEGLGSCWVGDALFCPEVVRHVLELPAQWEPMGAVAVGKPSSTPVPRRVRDAKHYIVRR